MFAAENTIRQSHQASLEQPLADLLPQGMNICFGHQLLLGASFLTQGTLQSLDAPFPWGFPTSLMLQDPSFLGKKLHLPYKTMHPHWGNNETLFLSPNDFSHILIQFLIHWHGFQSLKFHQRSHYCAPQMVFVKKFAFFECHWFHVPMAPRCDLGSSPIHSN